MVIWVLTAAAAPILCDPERAERWRSDAAIELERIPDIQPNLLPGLAQRWADPDTASRIAGLCGTGVSLAPGYSWRAGETAAWTFTLSRSAQVGCAVERRSATLSVSLTGNRDPVVSLGPELPKTVSPIGDCDTPVAFVEERLLDGGSGPVRVVLQSIHDADEITHRILVHRASASGWSETELLAHAPDRYTGGFSGPALTLLPGETPWIVAHGNRSGSSDACTAEPGQQVWRFINGAWQKSRGRDALALLARRGAWRLAGDPGWFLVVAQDVPIDRLLLTARVRRLQRNAEEPLGLYDSSSFPELNAGFVFAAPPPWPDEEAARVARRNWPRRTGVYVKRAWPAPDSCVR